MLFSFRSWRGGRRRNNVERERGGYASSDAHSQGLLCPIGQSRRQRELNPGYVGNEAELEHRIQRGRDVIHATDADVNGRRRRSQQARYVQKNHIARSCRMAGVIEYESVGVVLIVSGLDHWRLRVHVKQDGRDGIGVW